MKRYNGQHEPAKYVLLHIEKRIISWLTPQISLVFETYELTWLTLVWSMLILMFSLLAKNNILWLIGTSLAIVMQYLTDIFDGAVGRHKKTSLIKWGYYMDHFLDFVFLCSVVIGYSFLVDITQTYVFLFFLAVFAGFMMASFLEHSASQVFRISYFKIGPTEVRLLFILLNIAIMVKGPELLLLLLPYIVAISLIGLMLVVYTTQKRLWRIDMRERKDSNALSKRKLSKKYKYFRKKYIVFLLLGSIVFINCYVYITNPFHKLTIVKNPFYTTVENNQIVLHKNFSLQIGDNPLQRAFAFYKSAVHILANTYFGSIPAKSNTERGIISDIHALRFAPARPYLISGDHFSVLYPRNLGIFYKDILNPYTAENNEDWQNRERIFLQTTAYTLEAFTNAKSISTTIVPVGVHTVTLINIYAYPSDSLYGILYALDVMRNNYYPKNSQYPLQTTEAANELLYTYRDSLINLLDKYEQTVFDNKMGLVRTDIHLSSTRDAAIRQSSFYDNIIYWKTLQLASKLGIKQIDDSYLKALKERIIKKFWYGKGGYFIDDLSSESLRNKEYSSDWLIAVTTGFLDLQNPDEKTYIERSIAYIWQTKLDKPFGLRYRKQSDIAKEFGFVRYFVPSYGGSAIWSYWGMEYIKTLILLYEKTGNSAYLQTAEQNINAYSNNIVLYKGFPEVYASNGKFLENFFYKSIRQTGWVVEFENANWLLQTAKQNSLKY